MVEPGANVTTPSWADRSLVGAGLWQLTAFPSEVRARYFLYDAPLGGARGAIDAASLARQD